MPISTENILINSFNKEKGWTIVNDASDINNQQRYRCIRVGNQTNCNGEIIKNLFIRKTFEKILEKYNITNYIIDEIDTEYEFSYQLKLTEDVYNDFKKKMTNKDSENNKDKDNSVTIGA